MTYKLEKVSFAYDDKKVLEDINLEISRGSFIGILGANGSGKTTLLRLLSAYLKSQEGHILLDGTPIEKFSVRERARKVAVVPQQFDILFPFSVKEVVLMGRWAHLKAMAWESKRDLEVVQQAMKMTDCLHLQDRWVTELSGGERERVLLARALAQETDILLLDEPTTHLDLKHQVEIFQLLKKLHQEKKFTLVTVLHDLNFAVQSCEKLLLLQNGRIRAFGDAQQVLNEGLLKEVFGVEMKVHTEASTRYYFPNMGA